MLPKDHFTKFNTPWWCYS